MRVLLAILLVASTSHAKVRFSQPLPPNLWAQTLQFDLDFVDGHEEGRLQWNQEDGTLEYGMPGGNVNLQIGLEMLIRATNKTGSTLTNGYPVYVSGAQGGRPTIELGTATNVSAHHIAGLMTENVENNSSGYVCSFGYVRDVDTSMYSAGADLYLDEVAGTLSTNIPAYPADAVHVGTVLVSNPESGIIFVNPSHEMTFDLLSRTPLKVYSIEYTATNLYTDLRFPAQGIFLPGQPTDPASAVISNCVAILSFAANDKIYFNAQMPHEYWTGTSLQPHVHFISGSTVQTSNWSWIYAKAEAGETIQSPMTNTFQYISSGVSGEHELVNAGSIAGFTNGPSGMIGAMLLRNSGGPALVSVWELDYHYRIRYGSGTEYP